MQQCKIIGIGHPRTGTGFTAKLLSILGLDVGHETVGKDGIVAWQLIKQQGPYPYIKNLSERPAYSYLIYNIRNPFNSLPSIVYTEDTKMPSFEYRQQECNIPLDKKNPIDNAIISLTYFDRLIKEMNPSLVFRIEDQSHKLVRFFEKQDLEINHNSIIKKKVNRRKHPDFEQMINDFGDISNECKDMLQNYCMNYGYMKDYNLLVEKNNE